MGEQLSKVTTKHYCSECGSFNLQRTHRGFIKKTLLKLSIQYECKNCSKLFSEAKLEKNTTKVMPLFID